MAGVTGDFLIDIDYDDAFMAANNRIPAFGQYSANDQTVVRQLPTFGVTTPIGGLEITTMSMPLSTLVGNPRYFYKNGIFVSYFPNTLTLLTIRARGGSLMVNRNGVNYNFDSTTTKIKGINWYSGYPSSLRSLDIGFNYPDPDWIMPNIPSIGFNYDIGPSSLTMGDKLTSIMSLPSNLLFLDVSDCTGLTGLPDVVPATLQTLIGGPGLLSLPYYLPASLKAVDLRLCTGMTELPPLPSKLELLCTPPGLVSLPSLPDSIKVLELSLSTNITSLPRLPLSLEQFAAPPEVLTLPSLPNTIKALDLRFCTKLTSLPTLPSTLEALTSSPGLLSLPSLPTNLKTLDLYVSTKLTNLPTLNSGLESFLGPSTGITGVTQFTSLPSGLQILNIEKFINLTSLPEFPSTLDKINLSGCTKLTRIPSLSGLPRLIELSLSDCTGLTGLPTLPEKIEVLKLQNCKVNTPPLTSYLKIFSAPIGITGLTGLPPTLEELTLINCVKLTKIDLSGFRALTTLIVPTSGTTVDLTGCSSLTTLTLSPNTTTLNLSGCIKLPLLPNLPPTLTTLNISGLTGINGVFNYPTNLTSLIMKNCDGIIGITGPSKSKLTTLDISDCDNFRNFTIPPTLTALRIDNCGITGLDLKGSNISTLNITPNMFSRLTNVNLLGGKLKVSGLLRFEKPRFSNWTLY